MKYPLSSADVASYFDVAPRTVCKWARRKVDPLPGRCIFGRWHFCEAQIAAWAERQGQEVKA